LQHEIESLSMGAKYFIGTSGWHYEHWRGTFYPEMLPKPKWLEFYAAKFQTVELNNTFYRLPSEEAVAVWKDSTPTGFVFAAKASRYITHVKRFRNVTDSVGTFLERLRILGEKLGPVLYQTPPNMYRDDTLLASFLATLPRGQRSVFEFRHESWLNQKVFGVLREHGAGFCVFDMPDIHCPVVATSDFAYIRFHGSAGMYSSSYSDGALSAWARKIAGLASAVEQVYVYFNNDVAGYALDNARTLRGYLVG